MESDDDDQYVRGTDRQVLTNTAYRIVSKQRQNDRKYLEFVGNPDSKDLPAECCKFNNGDCHGREDASRKVDQLWFFLCDHEGSYRIKNAQQQNIRKYLEFVCNSSNPEKELPVECCPLNNGKGRKEQVWSFERDHGLSFRIRSNQDRNINKYLEFVGNRDSEDLPAECCKRNDSERKENQLWSFLPADGWGKHPLDVEVTKNLTKRYVGGDILLNNVTLMDGESWYNIRWKQEGGTCVGYALAGALIYQTKVPWISPYQIYHLGRDRHVDFDHVDYGCKSNCFDPFRSIKKEGYSTDKGESLQHAIEQMIKQDARSVTVGGTYGFTDYKKIKTDIDGIKTALATFNSPIAISMKTPDEFGKEKYFVGMSAPASNASMPDYIHGTNYENHALLVVGYNDHTEHVILKNSWGDGQVRWPYNNFFCELNDAYVPLGGTRRE